MSLQIVLIDFENIQPKDLHRLRSQECLVRVFVGRHQKTVALDTLKALQPLGPSAEYVRVEHAGRNALDFLLTFHLGRLTGIHPAAHFWIVSKDTDFDSLVRHLRGNQIQCDRVTSIEEIVPKRDTAAERVMKVTHYLEKLNGSMPRRLKTLRSTIRSLCGTVTDEDVDGVVEALKAGGLLTEADGKITYWCAKARGLGASAGL